MMLVTIVEAVDNAKFALVKKQMRLANILGGQQVT
eukprot:CAMPEP_0202714214 /NCGR_PEP_ID=MMETSP1385-20130828/66333_1 /ASSEMBLY_ACC=CAM_ASM_000861 /TAXON_ID=933848 /ORGANISM="Elphidium margaritaceum" /LENGTH=34 /DNA_ID= /DNA_START= /DNA_END= /DNA_ORIENTATION=